MTNNKAKKSKILALILGLTMCLALMLGIVFASPTSMVYAEGETLTPYDRIYINGEALNSGWYLDESYTQKKDNPTSGYVAKYKDGVLTLNNYHGGEIGTSAPASGYYKIDLIGENTINGGQRGVFIDTSREGRVTITSNANGKLTINASSANSVWGIACGASNSVKTTDVVIGGNAQVTINATSNGENRQVDGIHARNVTIEDNASVNITAKNTNNSTASQWVAGIFAENNVTINTNGNIDIDVSVAGGDSAYTVTLTGYTFATALSGNWITNLPAGLVQSVTRISDTEAKITVSGTPTALSDQFVEITIPKANITGLASDLTAESNSDAKFNIVATLTEIAIPKAKTNLTYTAGSQIGVEGGVGYTLTGNSGFDAGNYTAIAKLQSGYKWNDGTITNKEISWSIGKRNPVVSDFNFYEPSNLTYDGNAKTATVSLIAHYGDETGFAITVKYKKGGVIVAEAKDAGEYEVYIDTTATANFKSATDIHGASWKFTIAKAEQSAPFASLFTTVAPTTTTTTDGKITGITAEMEYRKVGDSAWTSGTGSDVTGLSSGTYQIRFKETVNYNAGAVVEVVVPESGVSSYNLTVTGGTGGGVFIQGASVTITANAPATGKKFSGWTIDGISGLDTTKTSLTFNMPAGNVTATANYEDIEYTITVNGGTADKSKAKYGESVTITANVPATGKEFDKWVVTGITLSDEDLAKSTVTFEMPASNVTMEAHFRDIEEAPSIEIKVEGGTGAGTYKEGDSVTVTAEDKEGKEFKCWKDESGKIVSTNKSYTFTVTEATTLTAVYEDKSSGGGEITPPAKKDGLSGGQIAGIVIGSVAVAGIGGFAIFWFAVKKKTFADLGAALKKGFTAIGNFFKTLGAKIKALFTKKK